MLKLNNSKKSTIKTDVYALAMYGCNTAVAVTVTEVGANPLGIFGYNTLIVTNIHKYNKLFYGPTLGIGVDYKSKPKNKAYWSIALLMPVRSPELVKYIEDIKTSIM